MNIVDRIFHSQEFAFIALRSHAQLIIPLVSLGALATFILPRIVA